MKNMIKRIVYEYGNVSYYNENGMVGSVPYVDNIEKRFIVANEIEYLKERLKKDRFDWKSNEGDRDEKLKLFNLSLIVGNAIVIGLPCINILFSYFKVGNFDLNSVLQELRYTSVWCSVGFPFVNLFSFMQLLTIPTSSVIEGYEAMCRYEVELLNKKEKELEELQKDNEGYSRYLNVNDNNGEFFKTIDLNYTQEIKDIDDALELRFLFVSKKNEIFKMYDEENLLNNLLECGFSKEVIAEFYNFVQQEYEIKYDNSLVLNKKKYK